MSRLTPSRFARELYAVFFTLIFILILPFTLLLFLPIYLFRYIVSILARLFRPDLGRLINTRSAVLAIDNPSREPKWNLCVWLIFEKQLNWDKFRDNYLRQIVDRKTEDGRGFAEPEYQQYYTTWLGFLFWAWDRHFNIANHIGYYWDLVENDPKYRERETSEEEFRGIVKKMTWAPFPEKKSPWQFLYIPNYRTNDGDRAEKSAMLFRLHHGLCDGFKILHILMLEANDIRMDEVAKPNYIPRPWWSRFVLPLALAIQAPYDMMRLLVQSNDHNEWHRLPEDKLKKPMNLGIGEMINVQRIKDLRKQHGVSFSAVLLASIAGGVRSLMIEKGVKVPGSISTALAVPIPGHPNKLRNHFIFSFLKLPVGIPDPRQRLLKMERNMTGLKRSTGWMLSFAMVPVVGGLFHWMMTYFNYNWYSTALLSNFPGPPDEGIFIADGGRTRVLDMNFAAGLGGGRVGLGFLMMSYNGGIRVISQADRTILPSDGAVDYLNSRIIHELDILKEYHEV